SDSGGGARSAGCGTPTASLSTPDTARSPWQPEMTLQFWPPPAIQAILCCSSPRGRTAVSYVVGPHERSHSATKAGRIAERSSAVPFSPGIACPQGDGCHRLEDRRPGALDGDLVDHRGHSHRRHGATPAGGVSVPASRLDRGGCGA